MPKFFLLTNPGLVLRVLVIMFGTCLLSAAFTNCSSGDLPLGTQSQIATATLEVNPVAQTIPISGSLQLVVSGGVKPYTYNVSEGSGTVSASGMFSTPTMSDVSIIVISDARGKQVTSTITSYTQVVAAPPLVITSSASTLNPGQAANLTVTGGTPPYTFDVISGSGSQSNSVFTAGNTAGPAVVRVSDSAAATSQTTITIVIPKPPQLWKWSGLLYQTSCPSLCDGVEYATCTGAACPAPRIQCYTSSPRGQPGHAIGTTQTTTPTGYKCSFF